jgi:protoporphyrinogen IX oxidase
MLWIKAFHIIAVVIWFSGLFYLPRLFVYHVSSHDLAMRERFIQMEKKLYYYVTTPGAALTVLLGAGLLHFNWYYYSRAAWLHIKLSLVIGLLLYHIYLGFLVRAFAQDRNRHNEKFYRWLNEAPTLFLVVIVILAVIKPFF